MKQRFLLSLLFVCSLAVTTHAQINKGATWLGGIVAYGQSTSKSFGTTYKTNSFVVGPSIGKAVKDNLVVGILASYQHSKSPDNTGTTSKTTLFGGGVFVRKYVPIVNQLYLFSDARAYYSNYNAKVNVNASKTKGFDVGITVTPGVSYGITKSIQIETGLNALFSTAYQKRTRKEGFSEYKTNNFNTGLSLDNSSALYIGFRFLLKKNA